MKDIELITGRASDDEYLAEILNCCEMAIDVGDIPFVTRIIIVQYNSYWTIEAFDKRGRLLGKADVFRVLGEEYLLESLMLNPAKRALFKLSYF